MHTRSVFSLAAATALAILLLGASRAEAACSGDGDSCAGTGTEWKICNTTSGATCTAYLDMTTANNIKFEVGTVSGTAYLGACVNISGTWTFKRLSDTSGNLITVSSMGGDVFLCLGAGDDTATVQGTGFTCSGATTPAAWSYGTDRRLALRGQAGLDTLTGGSGREQLCGGTDSDTLTGNGGNDDLDGWGDADTIQGSSGNSDTLFGYTGGDLIQDDAGTSDQMWGEDDADCVCDVGNQVASLFCDQTNGTDNSSSDVTCNYVNHMGVCNPPTDSGCEARTNGYTGCDTSNTCL